MAISAAEALRTLARVQARDIISTVISESSMPEEAIGALQLGAVIGVSDPAVATEVIALLNQLNGTIAENPQMSPELATEELIEMLESGKTNRSHLLKEMIERGIVSS